ncbi:MAG: DNA polymerase III subunit gamma/tau [Terriglobales bacterium]|uniref:DNA polymerase III subunit gamma/tau n=1 Tax=Bradyrhizobium sp. TaxID=376 RepID=UPI003C5192B9
MSYQVLARKYRPQKFSDVIGQEHVTRTLQNAIGQERIAHGYIFSGHRGIGKTTVARILAMALNCRSSAGPVPEPCGICESCTEIRAGNSVDVIEIDAATNRGIDEIRELRDAARYRPARDRFKIYILDEAHQITDAAFNALLKTLEEPPSHIIFMMATTQPEDIPQTIRSRCQHFNFRAVKFEDILQQLRDIAAHEKIAADDDALALLAEAGDGSMRDALSILDQAIASTAEHLTLDAVRGLIGSAPASALETVMQAVAESASDKILLLVDELLNEGHSPTHFARQLVRFLRNVTVAKITGQDSALLQVSSDERARVARIAELFGEEELARHLQIMLRTHGELSYRQEQRFHLELGLLKMAHAQHLLPIEQLLSDAALPSNSGQQRAGGRPVLATPSANNPEMRRTEPPARSSSISPFAADTARKSVPKAGSSIEPTMTASRSMTAATTNVVVMGSAAPAIVEMHAEPSVETGHAVEARLAPSADSLRDAVLNAFSNQPMLTSLLETAKWTLEGNSLIARVAASNTMIEMSFTSEARRIATGAASGAAGRALKVQVVRGGAAQTPTQRGVSGGSGNGGAANGVSNGSARSRAEHDPVVRRMHEKFGAEIRTVIDYREKGRN